MRYLVTMTSRRNHHEVWADSWTDAYYVWTAMRYSSKVERCTLHEYEHGCFSIRRDSVNPNYYPVRYARAQKDVCV